MNAFVLIDKAAGMTSFDVIRLLRRQTGIRKIGHAGTLDPFATGLLICAVGQYTRLLSYAEAQDKCYEASLLLGKRSASGDPETEIIEEREPELGRIDPQELREKALKLSELRLPAFSAIKIQGKRAYEYARAGKAPEMPMREVKIHDFEWLEMQGHEIHYRVRVSKGTYIRAFSEWLAEQTGNIGITTALRRISIGNLAVHNACPISQLESWQQYLCPPQRILQGLAPLELNEAQALDIQNGVAIAMKELPPEQDFALYSAEGGLLAIATAREEALKPKLVFKQG